jgi:carboxypeptidase A4
MKFIGVALASLGLASAASVTKKVTYDDWKVYRVNVGANAAKVNDVVNKLQLQLWKGKPSESSVVDVLVPPTQIKDFEASTNTIETRVMHENLGLSIAEEETISVYAGNYPRSRRIVIKR